MLRLRTADGLDMASFCAAYGDEAAAAERGAVERHKEAGLSSSGGAGSRRPTGCVGVVGEPQDRSTPSFETTRYRLSDPDGFLLSNSIISDIFAAFNFDKIRL